MTDLQRDRLAAAIGAIALILGFAALVGGRYDPGVRLAADNDDLVVTSVLEHSFARRDGVRPGMIVMSLNEVRLIDLPHYVYPAQFPDGYDQEGNPVEPVGVEPAQPTRLPLPGAQAQALLDEPIRRLEVIQPWELERGSLERGWSSVGWGDNGASGRLSDAAGAAFIGAGILLVAGWLIAQGRLGSRLQSIALPLAVAAAAPFLLRPLAATSSPVGIALFGILGAVAMVPLAHGLVATIDDERVRRLVAWAAAGCAAAAVLTGLVISVSPPSGPASAAWWGLAGAIPLIAGLAAAGPFQTAGSVASAASSGRLLETAEYAVAGATPIVALTTDSPPWLFPAVLWVAAIAFAGRVTIRPLARLVTRAQLQRDLIVAATEAERARVAADIHDDALQELTLLVRRLDAAGDAEGAEIARNVSDRLRAICGDLRLPILDDLGVGPALDWLVVRIERLAGGEVRLERSDGTRPPAEVELAFFRVAQEALANAVKHGSPPIVVRYRATDEGASLSIDDAGPGIAPDAGTAAEQAGRFGLLTMSQRAEQIGAILDIRRWPTGGTHVALEWRPR